MNEMWYALVQEDQLGPMSFEEIIDFYYKDIITSETLLWCDGMSEWLPITHIPKYSELLFQGAALPEIYDHDTMGPNDLEEATSIYRGSDLSSHMAHLQAPSANFAEAIPIPVPVHDSDDITTPPKSIPVSEDILSWKEEHQGEVKDLLLPEGHQLAVEDDPSLPLMEPLDPAFTHHPTPSDRSFKIGVMIPIILICVGLGIFSDQLLDLIASPSEMNQVNSTSVTIPPQPKEEVSHLDMTPPALLALNQNAKVEEDVSVDSNPLPLPQQKLDQGIELVFDEPFELEYPDQGVAEAPATLEKKKKKKRKKRYTRAKPKAKSKQKTKDELPVLLKRTHMEKVIRSNLRSIKNCTDKDPNLKGKTITILIGIMHSGKVTYANPTGRHLRNSPQKSCIIGVVKQFKFPAFQSDSMQVPLPIRL